MITAQTLRFHKQSSSPSPVTCEELITSAMSLYQGRLSKLLCRWRSECDRIGPSSVLRVMSGRRCQIICNSIDALSPQGGRLLLRGREGTEWPSGQKGLVITIADTGMGIAPGVMSHLFKPFFTTKGENGNGLGLWISHGIIARQQGRIKIKSSQNPRYRGTVVILFIPFEPAH
jgi:C4-dicarboxylate-specific signal transduction histidine kinase